jgi:hypothetical protein
MPPRKNKASAGSEDQEAAKKEKILNRIASSVKPTIKDTKEVIVGWSEHRAQPLQGKYLQRLPFLIAHTIEPLPALIRSYGAEPAAIDTEKVVKASKAEALKYYQGKLWDYERELLVHSSIIFTWTYLPIYFRACCTPHPRVNS